MRSAACRLVLGLQVVCAVPAALAQEERPRRLTLQWSDPEGQFRFERDLLEAEARALFAPLGIALEWAADGTAVARDGVQVILLSRDRSGGRMGSRLTMACVQRQESRQPALWIVVPQVRAALGLPAEPTLGEGPVLARALARVMSHELVHLIAPELPHAGRGLMSATLGRDFLRRPDTPVLDAGVARAVQQAAASWPPSDAGEGTPLLLWLLSVLA